MKHNPKSFLGRTRPGKWFLNAPHWPGNGARSLGRTVQTQGSMALGNGSLEMYRPTGPLKLSPKPVLKPFQPLPNPLLRCNNRSASQLLFRAVSNQAE